MDVFYRFQDFCFIVIKILTLTLQKINFIQFQYFKEVAYYEFYY
jgi:hypothetical protein